MTHSMKTSFLIAAQQPITQTHRSLLVTPRRRHWLLPGLLRLTVTHSSRAQHSPAAQMVPCQESVWEERAHWPHSSHGLAVRNGMCSFSWEPNISRHPPNTEGGGPHGQRPEGPGEGEGPRGHSLPQHGAALIPVSTCSCRRGSEGGPEAPPSRKRCLVSSYQSNVFYVQRFLSPEASPAGPGAPWAPNR